LLWAVLVGYHLVSSAALEPRLDNKLQAMRLMSGIFLLLCISFAGSVANAESFTATLNGKLRDLTCNPVIATD